MEKNSNELRELFEAKVAEYSQANAPALNNSNDPFLALYDKLLEMDQKLEKISADLAKHMGARHTID